jgi:hypothetical protein
MRKSVSILTLVLALGAYTAGPIVTKFGPFAATAAHAESGEGSDDHGGSGSDDHGGSGSDDHGSKGSDDDGADDSDDSDDAGKVGGATGPVFKGDDTASSKCKSLSCALEKL